MGASSRFGAAGRISDIQMSLHKTERTELKLGTAAFQSISLQNIQSHDPAASPLQQTP